MRRIWRWLARQCGTAAEWCYRRAQPVWRCSAERWFYRGRPIGRASPPWKVIVRADPCAYCGRPSETVDHLQPTSAGGHRGWPNEVGACRACNEAKAAMPLLRFLHARCTAERATERRAARGAGPPRG